MLPQLGIMEMVVIMGIAVLLFGKRLPEVGRSLGKGIVEFKKGLRGIEEEFDFGSTLTSTSSPSSRRSSSSTSGDYDRPRSPSPDFADTSVPKFEPPTTAPVPQSPDLQAQEAKD